MDQILSIEHFLVLILQLLGQLRNKLLDLLILDAECRGELLLASGKILLLGVQFGLVLVPSGLVLGGLLPRQLLGLLDVGLLHDKLHIALGISLRVAFSSS